MIDLQRLFMDSLIMFFILKTVEIKAIWLSILVKFYPTYRRTGTLKNRSSFDNRRY